MQNILIKKRPLEDGEGDWHVKICDLGLSRRVEGDNPFTTIRGTYGFMPPERIPEISREPHKADPFPADMWCLGEISFQLLTKQGTFKDTIELQGYVNGSISFPNKPLETKGVSNIAIEFLQSLMSPQPSGRLSAREANDHVWMTVPEASMVPSSGTSTMPEPSDAFTTTGNNGTGWSGDWTRTVSKSAPPSEFTTPSHANGKFDELDRVVGDHIAGQRTMSQDSSNSIKNNPDTSRTVELLVESKESIRDQLVEEHQVQIIEDFHLRDCS